MAPRSALLAVAAIAVTFTAANRAVGEFMVVTDPAEGTRFSGTGSFVRAGWISWTPDAVVVRHRRQAAPRDGGLSLAGAGDAPSIELGLNLGQPVNQAYSVRGEASAGCDATVPTHAAGVGLTTPVEFVRLGAINDDRTMSSFAAGPATRTGGVPARFILIPGLLVLAGLTLALISTRRP